MALSDRYSKNFLTLRIKLTKMNRKNFQAKYLAYHTMIVFRLINTTNLGVKNISKVTELFKKGSDNYKQFHRKEIYHVELSWPKCWVRTN